MSGDGGLVDLFADLQEDLQRLTSAGRGRLLERAVGRDFASNDYLAFADSQELRAAAIESASRGVPIGSGGSRLLRGNHPEHEALESAAATFFGCESCLYFSSGYAANQTLFATAPQRGDLVIYDEFIHASVHDGMRRGRAQTVAARHNDVQSIDDELRRWRAAGGLGRVWIAVESLYSMDADECDLTHLDELARHREAILVIDEAHATGVLGPGGRGRAALLEGQPHVVTIHTCGKALGTSGALVCAPALLVDFLINRGRAFIFSTAPSPLLAAVTRAALTLCEHSDSRRARLAGLVASAMRCLERRCGLTASGTHIIPIILGDDSTAVRAASRLRACGYDVRAIRPPTVPPGTARLRIALTLHSDEAAIDGLFHALAACLMGSPSE